MDEGWRIHISQFPLISLLVINCRLESVLLKTFNIDWMLRFCTVNRMSPTYVTKKSSFGYESKYCLNNRLVQLTLKSFSVAHLNKFCFVTRSLFSIKYTFPLSQKNLKFFRSFTVQLSTSGAFSLCDLLVSFDYNVIKNLYT